MRLRGVVLSLCYLRDEERLELVVAVREPAGGYGIVFRLCRPDGHSFTGDDVRDMCGSRVTRHLTIGREIEFYRSLGFFDTVFADRIGAERIRVLDSVVPKSEIQFTNQVFHGPSTYGVFPGMTRYIALNKDPLGYLSESHNGVIFSVGLVRCSSVVFRGQHRAIVIDEAGRRVAMYHKVAGLSKLSGTVAGCTAVVALAPPLENDSWVARRMFPMLYGAFEGFPAI